MICFINIGTSEKSVNPGLKAVEVPAATALINESSFDIPWIWQPIKVASNVSPAQAVFTTFPFGALTCIFSVGVIRIAPFSPNETSTFCAPCCNNLFPYYLICSKDTSFSPNQLASSSSLG